MSDGKSFWEVFLTPIMVAIVGASATYVIHYQQRELATELAEKERENAVDISIAQIENSERLKSFELLHEKNKYKEENKLSLIKKFRNDLLDCQNNKRVNSLILIGYINAELSSNLSTQLVDCQSDDVPPIDVKKIGKQEGKIRVNLNSVTVHDDGTRGVTNWYFRLLVNGKKERESRTISLSDAEEKKSLDFEFSNIAVIDGDSYEIAVEAVRAKGNNRGLRAFGEPIYFKVDLSSKEKYSDTVNISVPGFADKGDFSVFYTIAYM